MWVCRLVCRVVVCRGGGGGCGGLLGLMACRDGGLSGRWRLSLAAVVCVMVVVCWGGGLSWWWSVGVLICRGGGLWGWWSVGIMICRGGGLSGWVVVRSVGQPVGRSPDLPKRH